MSCREARGARIIVLIALVPFMAGCPLPIAHTETLSAPMVGVVQWTNGTPLSGAQIAVYTADRCEGIALSTTTDSLGAFAFPRIRKRYGVMWVIPGLDRAPPTYSLCMADVDSLRPVYRGYVPWNDTALPDSVTCLAWAWHDRPRVTCSSLLEETVALGGRWTDSATSGQYRVILTREPTRIRGFRIPVDRPHAYVQWIQEDRNEGTAVVRTTVELLLDGKVTDVQKIELWQHQGTCHVTLRGWKNASRILLTFELGLPGQTAKVDAR